MDNKHNDISPVLFNVEVPFCKLDNCTNTMQPHVLWVIALATFFNLK